MKSQQLRKLAPELDSLRLGSGWKIDFSARRGSRKTFGDSTLLDASHPESEGIRL